MTTMFRNTFFALFATSLMIVSAPALAQRTGDGIVPSIETVCEGDPFNFGLCNAYCEALDCDSDTPLGTPKACANKLKNYLKHSGGALPPCEQVSCPCDFDTAKNFEDLVVLASEGGDVNLTDADIEATLQNYCNTLGVNSELTEITDATEVVGPLATAQGLRLYQWVSENPASCNVEGGGFDGVDDPTAPNGFWSYGPFIDEMISLDKSELTACKSALAKLCE